METTYFLRLREKDPKKATNLDRIKPQHWKVEKKKKDLANAKIQNF